MFSLQFITLFSPSLSLRVSRIDFDVDNLMNCMRFNHSVSLSVCLCLYNKLTLNALALFYFELMLIVSIKITMHTKIVIEVVFIFASPFTLCDHCFQLNEYRVCIDIEYESIVCTKTAKHLTPLLHFIDDYKQQNATIALRRQPRRSQQIGNR